MGYPLSFAALSSSPKGEPNSLWEGAFGMAAKFPVES